MFEHDHLSGRFTATPAEEEAALDEIMTWADLITTTEVSGNLRARCLREPGFTAVFGNKGSRDDCGLAVRNSRFNLLDGGTETLSPLTYITERGVRSDTTEGAYAVVEDKHEGGEVGVVVVVHMPHGMQDALRTGKVGDDVARAYRDILRGARRLANRLARKWKAGWTQIVGDWNLNIKRLWVQAYLRLQFPNYRVNFTKPYPVRGTFSVQIIDRAMLRGIKVRKGPTINPAYEGFDHRGFSQGLAGK